jgi:hypothetical protein
VYHLVTAALAQLAAACVTNSALWLGINWFAPASVDLDNKAQHATVCMLMCVEHILDGVDYSCLFLYYIREVVTET